MAGFAISKLAVAFLAVAAFMGGNILGAEHNPRTVHPTGKQHPRRAGPPRRQTTPQEWDTEDYSDYVRAARCLNQIIRELPEDLVSRMSDEDYIRYHWELRTKLNGFNGQAVPEDVLEEMAQYVIGDLLRRGGNYLYEQMANTPLGTTLGDILSGAFAKSVAPTNMHDNNVGTLRAPENYPYTFDANNDRISGSKHAYPEINHGIGFENFGGNFGGNTIVDMSQNKPQSGKIRGSGGPTWAGNSGFDTAKLGGTHSGSASAHKKNGKPKKQRKAPSSSDFEAAIDELLKLLEKASKESSAGHPPQSDILVHGPSGIEEPIKPTYVIVPGQRGEQVPLQLTMDIHTPTHVHEPMRPSYLFVPGPSREQVPLQPTPDFHTPTHLEEPIKPSNATFPAGYDTFPDDIQNLFVEDASVVSRAKMRLRDIYEHLPPEVLEVLPKHHEVHIPFTLIEELALALSVQTLPQAVKRQVARLLANLSTVKLLGHLPRDAQNDMKRIHHSNSIFSAIMFALMTNP
ncbi:uncharacterized protein BXIN_0353 [Babesia sp. Xinjiang]|uniref:uncharacterized protein n=1 Tax=Babesia sp. Xinjiang TaxID=462227 RepID=UPI000A243CC7|nr:uncharacterized protein BXIN_0353 [Babesia sp. Xinjiang]ORM41189.1 hypothetical protein BXIN_0353 [Babesia sp. Xinjiang]